MLLVIFILFSITMILAFGVFNKKDFYYSLLHFYFFLNTIIAILAVYFINFNKFSNILNIIFVLILLNLIIGLTFISEKIKI